MIVGINVIGQTNVRNGTDASNTSLSSNVSINVSLNVIAIKSTAVIMRYAMKMKKYIYYPVLLIV